MEDTSETIDTSETTDTSETKSFELRETGDDWREAGITRKQR